MRWDELFADLEAQLEHGLATQEQEQRTEDERLRVARLRLRDRLMGMGAVGPIALDLGAAGAVRLRLRTAGADWIAGDVLDSADAAQAVVPVHAVRSVLLPDPDVVPASLQPPAGGALTDRLGVGTILRDLARRRRVVSVRLTDGAVVTGTIDRAGRDHLDLAEHPLDAARQRAAVRRIRIVAFEAVALVTAH